MILDAILYVLYGATYVFTLPLRLLSDVVLPAAMTNALTTASGYLGAINSFFPVQTLIDVLGLLLAVEGYILLYKGLKWVWSKIPGVN